MAANRTHKWNANTSFVVIAIRLRRTALAEHRLPDKAVLAGDILTTDCICLDAVNANI
jgi:hypothetical protein